MKRRSGMLAAATASAMVASAIVATVTAEPASASTSKLCLSGEAATSVCLFSNGVNQNVTMDYPSYSTWTYPGTGQNGAIKSGGLCLQLNNSGGNIVRMATCNGDQAEQWANVYDSAGKRTWFESLWANENLGEGAMCLEGAGNVWVVSCVSDYAPEDWGSS